MRRTAAIAFLVSLSSGVPAAAAAEDLHFAFDHVGWMVDRETLVQLVEASMLGDELAHASVRRTPDGDPVALYLYGDLTYLEFMDFEAARWIGLDVGAGDGMVAFNAEREGSVDWIVARMGEKHPESSPKKHLRTLSLDGQELPWFHAARFDYATGHEGFGAWVKEYHREFKHRASGGRTPVGEVTRIRDHPRVAHDPDKLFQDVLTVTAAVSETRRRNLVKLLAELGYEIEERGGRTVCSGEENVLELVPRTDQKYSITRVRLSLTREREGERELRLGPDIVLRFEDGAQAIWEFGGNEVDEIR